MNKSLINNIEGKNILLVPFTEKSVEYQKRWAPVRHYPIVLALLEFGTFSLYNLLLMERELRIYQ